MNLELVTAPTIEPISMDDLVIFLRIDEEDYIENQLLESILSSSRGLAETITRRALLTQTWDYYLNCFPPVDAFKLPFGNLQTVTHVKYTDSDGTQTTMTANTDYLVETNSDSCGRIVLPYDTDWPDFVEYPSKPIVIRFVAGWTDRVSVPEEIKTAIRLIAADLYENREAQNFVAVPGVDYIQNKTVMKMLMNHRLWDNFL